jgi:hypothetical protein
MKRLLPPQDVSVRHGNHALPDCEGDGLAVILTLPRWVADPPDVADGDAVEPDNVHDLNEYRAATAVAGSAGEHGTRAEELAPAPVNPAVFAAIFHGILREYRRTSDEDAASLESAVQLSDVPRAMKITRRMKGASMMLGATGFADACGQIESAMRANDAEAIRASMDAWHAERARLKVYVEYLETTLVREPLARLTEQRNARLKQPG